MDEEKYIQIIERLTAIETLLKSQDYKAVNEKASDALNIAMQNKKDIDEIKEKNKWYYRTIVGAFLVTMVGTVITLLKLV